MKARWHESERVRATIAASVGLIALAVGLAVTVWELAILIAWIATCATLLAWTWGEIWRLGPEQTAQVATREDDSRTATRMIVVGAAALSLAAVVIGLRRASAAAQPLRATLITVAMLTVVASWCTVHSLFMLRYAHLFYRGNQPGGIEFPGRDAPSYRDFAYLGFTVGMTFQVSDTAIDDREIRATVLRHAVVSYLFGTAIIAATINVLAGLIR